MKLHKRVSLLLTMGIMAIGLITFKFSPAEAKITDKTQSETPVTSTPTPVPTVTSTPTPEPTPTPVPNDLVKLAPDSDIQKLIERYLEAKLSCDKEQFTDIVSDTSYIDEESLQQKYETIISFSDVTCYAKKGTGLIDYIVYYTYYSDIATIETKGISIDRAFISTDDEGNYRIYIGNVDIDTENYVKAINYDDDVRQLLNDTYAQIEEEISKDDDLLKYWMRAYLNDDLGIDFIPDGNEISGDEVTSSPDESAPEG